MRRLILLAAGLGGCIQEIDESNPLLDLDKVPDFTLVNFVDGEDVSPADYQGHASAYYFGHAT